ncbi:MAG: hypothetical protein IH623_05200 [Verrucomicrobia bacterium]|nr:hypothetical protein [Verrucomicrobiota bacterium]
MKLRASQSALFAVLTTLIMSGVGEMASAQQPQQRPREFPPGALRNLEQLPASRLRTRIEGLPPGARQRAVGWLQQFHFTELDLESLETDSEGGIYYVDMFEFEPATAAAESEPPVSQAAVPVSPFPANLVFHSRPGAPNVLFLNFAGEEVSGTAWNTSLGRTVIPALPFSSDSDYSTFSDSEQTVIKRVWQRVAEDYAPFDIDVTTERPASFNSRTAHALITRNTDANGDSNPSSSAGGVAYVNVFGGGSFANYRPAWVYHNNLGNSEANICEATSHELGHNLGLSHDGKTDGTSYYGGHGSGDISWGPIMGTGYSRNVSQWSKGEYYLANNTQDDLSIIASKTAYRLDDHGNTPATASPLVTTGGTNVVSTTPENDPFNLSPANKGVLQSSTDVDVFSFVTGSGPMRLAVNPWIMPSGTRGGNLDILLELFNESGIRVFTNNPASQTTAVIQTNLPEGLYFLYVRNTGVGNPLSSTPSGYTAYASLGQYFISGYVTPSDFVAAPQAELLVTDLTQTGSGLKSFTVTYSDNLGVDVSTLDNADLRITGPDGYNRAAQFISVDVPTDGTPRVVTYAAEPPTEAVWTTEDNGTYTIWMQANEVGDLEGAWVAATQLGQFEVDIPTVLHAANMNTDPGWVLEPQWAYGQPAYPGAGPVGGFTGANLVAYNLSGNYANQLATKYATTPAINCAGYTSLKLKFRRWLRLRSSDTALIQVSTNGTDWSNVWSTTQSVSDNAWQEMQYSLPDWAAGSPAVQIRWGIGSNISQNDIGWNLDDVEVVGYPNPNAPPVTATLTVTVNHAGWGEASPTNVVQPAGSSVQITAHPATYFVFSGWAGDAAGTDNPLTVSLNANQLIQANFSEIVTANYATPHWWLAANGYTDDLETAVVTIGANGFPLWQSHVAGLNPNDPDSQFRLALDRADDGTTHVLNWNTVTGRVYTVWSSANPFSGFTPVAGAATLPWTVQSLTNIVSTASPAMYYRVEVQKP